MRIKIVAVLVLVLAVVSCYSVPAKVELSPVRIEFNAEGGIGSATYGCVMGVDFGCEATQEGACENTAEIKKEKNNTFYLYDDWVEAIVDGESKTIVVAVSPNYRKTSREYKIAVWCGDVREILTIYQTGNS